MSRPGPQDDAASLANGATSSEAAETLSISPREVWRRVAAGKIPPPVRTSGCTRWRLTQIDQYIASLTPAFLPDSADRSDREDHA